MAVAELQYAQPWKGCQVRCSSIAQVGRVGQVHCFQLQQSAATPHTNKHSKQQARVNVLSSSSVRVKASQERANADCSSGSGEGLR
jgi:hypothetical protein